MTQFKSFLNRYWNLAIVLVVLVAAGAVVGVHAYKQKRVHDEFVASLRQINKSATDTSTGCANNACNTVDTNQQSTCHMYACVDTTTSTGTSNTCITDELAYYGSLVGGKITRVQAYTIYVRAAQRDSCTIKSQAALDSTADNSNGYNAGYNYAQEYQICDPTYSNGNSQDFNDGVNAWAADNCTNGQLN